MEFTREVQDALGAPFPDDEIEFLPRASSGGKALGLPYIDARSVMRRLDAVVGPGNWSFDFDLLSPDGKMVKGRLTVLGVTKCDAGEGATEDEVLKSAVSDALKRCAVHFGIGRYLYYLPRVWAPYDAQKRRFTEQPRLDPAAVRHALAICGIGAPAPRPAEVRLQQPERRAPEEAPVTAARKSIWSAGGRPDASEAPAPESVGDHAAGAPRVPAADAPPVSLVCSGAECGKPLTRGQHDVSVRAFGQPLCPSCQKQHARLAA
ncbi:MAG TPA: Rad52/Rad22 family DNA repair protein [Armatimonadota bacterium]|nr:Rad52/Rad22 family DNA repair protein [Armatimonadota bacterium]